MGVVVFPILLAIVLLYGITSFRTPREYERIIVYTLGRFTSVKGPGPTFVWAGFQQGVRIDLRVRTIDVPTQDVISKDNISVKVNAVVYFRVLAPEKAVNNVADFMRATSELAQTTLRSVLGKHELDEMLSERDKLSKDIREILDHQTDQWGIKVSNVELKHIDIAESMIRAIARQAEAERERRAKIISAEGELQAADKLVEAARKLAADNGAMQLRYLSAFQDIANDKTNTIILPLPLDLLKRLGG
jgi:regulator of protease activity HflC (stomatin/prohibitin superfamily)